MASIQLNDKVAPIPSSMMSLFTKVKLGDKIICPISITQAMWDSFLQIAEKFAALSTDDIAKYTNCANWTADCAEKQWYTAIILPMSSDMLFEKINISNVLGFNTLLNILYRAIAEHIHGKSADEIHAWMDINNNLPDIDESDWWSEDFKISST